MKESVVTRRRHDNGTNKDDDRKLEILACKGHNPTTNTSIAIRMTSLKSILTFFLLLVASSQAFAPLGGATSGGSAFVVSQRASAHVASTPVRRSSSSSSALYMGSKAKFGVFSPAVYAGKIVLGQDRLNKIRGKAISLHSEKIGQFCTWVGAYHLRTRLIKKAKVNGDTLGFLV